MNAIYEPKGAALEYAPLACNLFRGCTHGCRYCYTPGVLRMTREDFHREALPRSGIMDALIRDARRLDDAGDTRRVHLCFTCDPFPQGGDHSLTLDALRVLKTFRRPVAILTKGLLTDADLAVMEGSDVEVGVSLVWGSDEARAAWEPGTATVVERAENLRRARERGLRTFVSVEPVIDPVEAFWAIGMGMAVADEIRVGRLNHMDTPQPVDWRRFAVMVAGLLVPWAAERPGRTWMLKKGLRELVEG